MKAVFCLSIGIYGLIAFWGIFANDYTEVKSKRIYFESVLVPLIIASVIIGALYFIFLKMAFPLGFKKQPVIAKILLPVAFIILSFVFNRGVLPAYNCQVGKQRTARIAGLVWQKDFEKGSKATKFYYLVINDTTAGVLHKIKCV